VDVIEPSYEYLGLIRGFYRYNTLMKIGTDIVQINRIEKSLTQFGDKFKQRFLLPQEIVLVKKTASLAGFWAAKEAISKALGCGIGSELSFHDIIIAKDSRGAPIFSLSTEAQKKHKIKESSLSISHDGGFAIAVAVISQ
jgi:holo-[acyl-carrier protein] synthase